ncbi:hypothetical protein PENTCL1PPCAC_14663, partial [Pristionchus entomophagus]
SVLLMSFFLGKSVIVTGSSNGIGRGTAVLFAKRGAKVTITGRNAVALKETKLLCRDAGAADADILDVLGDITDDTFCAKLVAATVNEFGKLDVLVNNAGGAGDYSKFDKPIEEIPLTDLDKMLDLNLKQVLRISQRAVPHLEKTKGAIVNLTSIGAQLRLSGMPFYSAAHSALDQITVQLAGSLIKKGIRVNSVSPGPVLTNFAIAAGASEAISAKMFADMAKSSPNPQAKAGTPEDIAKVILFLADRSQSEIIVGHILTADGGVSLKNPLFPDV